MLQSCDPQIGLRFFMCTWMLLHLQLDAYWLNQERDGNIDFPIYYASRQLNSAEKNYTTTEREGLAMIYAVKKFRHYLLCEQIHVFCGSPSATVFGQQALQYGTNRQMVHHIARV